MKEAFWTWVKQKRERQWWGSNLSSRLTLCPGDTNLFSALHRYASFSFSFLCSVMLYPALLLPLCPEDNCHQGPILTSSWVGQYAPVGSQERKGETENSLYRRRKSHSVPVKTHFRYSPHPPTHQESLFSHKTKALTWSFIQDKLFHFLCRLWKIPPE